MFRRRRRFGRRRRFRTRRRNGSYRSKFIQHNRMGRGGPRPELKYSDYYDNNTMTAGTTGGANFVSSGSVPRGMAVLNVTMEGAAAWNRIGRRINMKSIEVTLMPVFLGNPGAASTEMLRVALVYDKQYNNTYFTNSSTIWQSDRQTSGGTGSTASIMSPVNLSNRDRFLILKEWRWGQCQTALGVLPSAASSIASTIQARLPAKIHWYVKLRGLETVYNGTTGTPDGADVTSGALLLVFLSNQSNGNQSYQMGIMSRLRFYD